MGAILEKVVGPDMVAGLGPKADAGSVREPQPPALGLLLGNLEPLAAPDAFDALVVPPPARIAQQGRDLAIAVAAVLACEFDQVGREGFLVIMAPRRLALGRAVLPERLARRSEMLIVCTMCSTQARRRAGLRSFPGRPPAGSVYPA